jgi:hypothetical protein
MSVSGTNVLAIYDSGVLGAANAPRIDLAGMVGALLITQVLPLLLGLVVRHWRPQLAE